MKSLWVWIGLLASVMFIFSPQSASASSLFEHSKTEVPVGQTIDNVYVVGGDTDILGYVTGAVVVVNGNLHLGATSRVDGAIVVIGGSVKQQAGSVTSNDIYNFTVDTGTQNSLLIGGGMIAGLWILQLSGSLLLIIIPVLIKLTGRSRAEKWIKGLQELSWRKSLSLGAVSGVILAAFSLLCIFTVVGIPFLTLVILILLAALILGITSLSYQIGGLIQGSREPNEWTRLILGAVVIAAFSNIPLIGGLMLLLITLLALGHILQWSFKLRNR